MSIAMIVAFISFALAAALVVCVILIALARKRRVPFEPKTLVDWRPTLRMDARADAEIEEADDDAIPANWVCRTQEIRLVSSVSGSPHAEVRWRHSTRREVKELFSVYHKAMLDEIEKRAKTLRAPELPAGQ